MSKLELISKCFYYLFSDFGRKLAQIKKKLKIGRQPVQDLSHCAFLIATRIFEFLRRLL